MTRSWIDALAAYQREGTPSVLVTVLETRGSAPREAGAKIVVSAHGQDGSIGGGTLEHRCVELSRALLDEAATTPRVEAFPLGPALGQCCGGHVRILFEPLFVRQWSVALFGAGHVGQALARLLATLPCRLRWIDSRAGQFPTLPPSVSAILREAPETEVPELPSGASVLVMTHDHALDYRIVGACLRRDDMRFVGLIGSATKAARFRARLTRDGFSAAAVGRLECPIGVPGAGGKLPDEIAISVAAHLLQVRDAPAAPIPVPHRAPLAVAPLVVECGGCEACTA